MHRYNYKSSTLVLLLAGTFITAMFNSCKKDDLSPLKNYLTGYGTWQLASLQVSFFKHTATTVNITSTDTLNYACGDNTQKFNFSSDGTCTYSYFQCSTTQYKGNWSINVDSVRLHSDILMPDSDVTTDKGKHPFATAAIDNLGPNSLVLLTGDIGAYYSDDKPHRIYRYSFIHPSE